MVGRTQPGAAFAARTGNPAYPARINFPSAAQHRQNVTGVTGVNEFSRAVGVGFLNRHGSHTAQRPIPGGHCPPRAGGRDCW